MIGTALARTPAVRRATALVLVLIAAACSPFQSPAPSAAASASAAAAATSTPAPAPTASPTPSPAPVVWPLTGIKADDHAKVKRRPLNVRLPNDPSGRPQVGLAKADIVFEMIVEGGVTRLSAIFHSQDPKAIGPIRSYRWSDLHITQMLKGALVASGATVEERDGVTASVRAGNMISVDAERDGRGYYRVNGRGGLNNLFIDPEVVRRSVNDAGGAGPVDVPPLAFFPSLEHDPMGGGFKTATPAATVTIPLRDPSTFTYDPGPRGYARSQTGARTIDPDGNVPINARNVIVIHTDIWETSVIEDIFGSKGLDYRMTGDGKAEIFRGGLRVDGTWRRPGVLDMFGFFDQAGERILLDPGQTWFHFVLPTTTVTSQP